MLTPSRHLFRAVLLTLTVGVTLAVPYSLAQPEADSLVWEFVGQTFQAHGLFAAGVDDDLDPAVYANGFDGLFVIHPGDEDWTLVALRNEGGFRATDDVMLTLTGTLLANSFARIQRSADGGQTWTDVSDGEVAPVYTPAGALITGYGAHPTDTILRSTDDGLTWEQIDMMPTLGERVVPVAFAVLPPSDDLPGGRIVAGGVDGLVYSDDDGFSWEPTNVFGTFAYFGAAVLLAPWGDPPGTLYAQVNGTATGTVWESTDGAVWTEVGQIPGIGGGGANMAVAGDAAGGVLYAADDGGTEDIQVYASWDRGQTWIGTGQIDAEEEVGNPVRLQELIVGPEGRLWLGMTQGTGGPGLTGGVFRTVAPVFPVSAEEGPEGAPGKRTAELGAAYPNPSSGAVTIPFVLPEAAEVSVSVFDVLGRRVAVLADGRLEAGRRELTLDGAKLPAGLYVVRASGDRFTTTRHLTITR